MAQMFPSVLIATLLQAHCAHNVCETVTNEQYTKQCVNAFQTSVMLTTFTDPQQSELWRQTPQRQWYRRVSVSTQLSQQRNHALTSPSLDPQLDREDMGVDPLMLGLWHQCDWNKVVQAKPD